MSQSPTESDGNPAQTRRTDGLLTTGDMARLSHNTLRTVRFYEEAGVLRASQRTQGGHRLFVRSELRRLRLISDLRAAGWSLDDIRDVLEAKSQCNTGAEAAADMTRRLDQHVEVMEQRLDVLQRLVGELKEARNVLQRCRTCQHNRYFPDACGQCEVMMDAAEVPQAVNVLWNMNR